MSIAVLALTGCNSTGVKNSIKQLSNTSIPATKLQSKPVQMDGLQHKAKENSEVVVRSELKIAKKDDFEVKNYQVTIGDYEYKAGDTVDLKNLGGDRLAPITTDVNETFDVYHKGKKAGEVAAHRKGYLYQQEYSIIGTLDSLEHTIGDSKHTPPCGVDDCDELLMYGKMTQAHRLPKTGTAQYTGVAAARNPQATAANNAPKFTTGSLAYHVDFDNKVGSGSINFTQDKPIKLQEAMIQEFKGKNTFDNQVTTVQGVDGRASWGDDKVGRYQLGFFGDDAQQIAGYVDIKNTKNMVDVMFQGSKESK